MSNSTFVIGDVHGHLNRLEALLKQEGLVDDDGNRLKPEVEVVQLGDLGHFGEDTKVSDRATYKIAPEWLDVILLGNHDIAVINGKHQFYGYAEPLASTRKAFTTQIYNGKVKLAYEAHGYLFTHAGLHPQHADSGKVRSARHFAAWLNEKHYRHPAEYWPVRDDLSPRRGAKFARHGGILWRDADEDLFPEYKQIFGHTSRAEVRYYPGNYGESICIDVGSQFNGKLCGVWLPEEEIAGVELDEEPYDDPQITEMVREIMKQRDADL